MTYLQNVDKWLDEQIERTKVKSDLYVLKQDILKKIVQSFHNGQRACPKCNPRPPKQAS